MHLKQFKWKTVPKARTKAPCIDFPQAAHVDPVTVVDEVWVLVLVASVEFAREMEGEDTESMLWCLGG
jgi:hypothetical protein